MNPQLLLTWLDEHPRARSAVYTAALTIAAICVALAWLLPLVDVDHIWRVDLDDLSKVGIVTGAGAAYLARRNVPPPGR